MSDPFAEFDAITSGMPGASTPKDVFSEFEQIISTSVQPSVTSSPVADLMRQLSTQPQAKKPIDKSMIMEPVTGIVAGFADVAELAAQAIRLGDVKPKDQGPVDSVASWIIDNKQALQKEYPYLFETAVNKDSDISNWVRKALHHGVSSAIQSGATMVPGALIGSAGGPFGTILGAAVSGGTIFGLAEYDRFAQDIFEYNKKHPGAEIPDEVWKPHAVASSIQEGGLEFLSDAVLAKMFKWGDVGLPFKGTVRSLLEQGGFKAGAKNFLKAYTASAAAEIPTEMTQSFLETQLRTEAGLPQQQEPWESAVESIGPTIVSTLLLGAGSHTLNARKRGQIVDALTNPEVDPEVRFDAAHAIYSELQKFDKANNTQLADKWGNVALYRIANNEAIDIDNDVATEKGIVQLTEEKVKQEELNLDVEKFEARQQPQEEPVIEEEKPTNDKETRQLYGYETFNYLKQKFIDKGLSEERAIELSKTIMGAREEVKAPETVIRESILLDESGKPIKIETPVDSMVSTSGALFKEGEKGTILQLPEMLRQFAIQSKSGKPFSSKGAVTTFLKQQKTTDHVPFQIAEKSWIALPNHIFSLMNTARITARNMDQPPGFIFTPTGLKVIKKRKTPDKVDMSPFAQMLRDDDILAKNGQPFLSPVSALANLKARDKVFPGIIDRYAVVPLAKNEQGKLVWIARRRSQLSIDALRNEFTPTAKEEKNAGKDATRLESEIGKGQKLVETRPDFGRGPRPIETGGNVQEQPEERVPEQVSETPGESQQVEEKEQVTEQRKNNALRANIDKLTPEEKDQALQDLRTMTLTSPLTGLKNRLAYMMSQKKKFQVSIDLDSLKYINDFLGHENGDNLLKAFANALGVATDDAYHISGDEFIVQGDSKTHLEKLMKALTKALSKTTLTVEAGDGRIFTKKGVDFSYGIGKDLQAAEGALAEHKRLRTVSGQRAERGAVPRGLAEVTPTATEEPTGEDTSTTVSQTEKVEKQPGYGGQVKERVYAKTITARLEKGENVPDKLVAKFPSVAKKWKRNDEGKWEKVVEEEPRLLTEREKEIREDARNVDKAIKKAKEKREKEGTAVDDHPVRTNPKFLTVEQTKLLVDRYFQFDRGKGVYVPKPVADHQAMIDTLYALINYRWHNTDGKVNLEYVAKWIDDMCAAYDAGQLDKYFGTTEQKSAFNETLDQLIGFFNVVSDELVNQVGNAKLAIAPSKLNPLANRAREKWGTSDDPTGMGRYMFADGSYLAGTTEHYDVADLMPEDQLEHSDDYVEDFNRNYNKVIDWFLENAGAIRLYLTEDIDRRNNLIYKELHLNVFENLVISNEMFKQLQRLVRMGNGHIVYDIVKRDGKVISGETNSLSQFMRDLNNAKFAFGNKKSNITVKQVHDAIAPITTLWKTKPEIIVIDSITADELPTWLKLKITEENISFNGVFIDLDDKPTVFLVAKEFANIEEAQRVLLHEAIGHFGLRKVLGNKLNSILNQVYYSNFNNQKFKEIVSRYGFNTLIQNERLAAAEEYLAHMAETNSGPVSLWKRIISTVRRTLYNMGFNVEYSDSDIKVLLANINKALQTGEAEIDPGTLTFDGVNWAIKVKHIGRVPGYGSIITAYHGTRSLFDKFDNQQLGIYTKLEGWDKRPDQFAHFFTIDRAMAEEYTGPEDFVDENYGKIAMSEEFEEWWDNNRPAKYDDMDTSAEDFIADYYDDDRLDDVFEDFLIDHPDFRKKLEPLLVYKVKIPNSNLAVVDLSGLIDKRKKLSEQGLLTEHWSTEQIAVEMKKAQDAGYAGVLFKNFPNITFRKTGDVIAVFDESNIEIEDKKEMYELKELDKQGVKFSLTGGVTTITPTTPPKQSKNLFNAETRALIKTLASLRPGALPKMTLMEQILKSPEWYSHPVLRKIVDHAINRHDRFYELFNDFNGITDNEKKSVIDQTMELKNKGLTQAQILLGQTSKDYQLFEKIIDDLDTGDWREGQPENFTHDEYLRQQNVPEDVVRVFRLHREAYDKALDLLMRPMIDVVEAVERDARKASKKPKYPTMQMLDDQGKSTTVTLREVLDHMNTLRGTYAPRLREPGDWEITARKDGQYYRYHKSLRYDAELLAERLKQQGFEVNPVKERERLPEDVYATLRVVNIAHLLDIAMQRADVEDAEIKTKFNEELLKEVADLIRVRGFRSSMVRRRPGTTIRGYITDPNERFVRYINNISAGTAKAEAAKAMFQEITGHWEGEGEARKKILGIDPMTERRAYDVATRYIEEQLRNADHTDRIIGYLKSVATMKYLGFNPHAWLVNILSLGTTVPMAIHQYVLNGQGSMISIAKYVSEASADYVKVMRGGQLVDENERAFMEEIKRKGYDDPKYTRDAAGTIQRTHGQLWSKLMYKAMFVFGKTEQWIRGTTMLAAYRLAKKQDNNISEEDAIKKAYDASNKAHGIYGKATLPSAALGKHPFAKFIQLLYTFQKFPHNYLQMLYDVGFKKKNIKGFMFGLMSPVVLGGAAVWPFKDLWWSMLRGILRLVGIIGDPEKWFWDTFRKQFGQTSEKIARHGVLGAAGIDISGSLAIGVGIPKDIFEMFGVASGLASDVYYAGRYLSTGQYLRATEKVLPTAFGNVLRAIREMNTGMVDSKGRRIWDDNGKPMMPDSFSTAARLAGFRTSNQALTQERNWETRREMDAFKVRRDNIYEEYRAYLVEEERDPDKLQKVRDKIRKYNDAVRESGKAGVIPLITREAILTQIKSTYRPKKGVLLDLKRNQ